MRARWLGTWAPVVLVVASSCAVTGGGTRPRRDGAVTNDGGDPSGDGGVDPVDSAPAPCVDTDNDGISDPLETDGDDDSDGTPNVRDDDSDGDGFPDRDESIGHYPSFPASRMPLVCGQSATDCDMDGIANFRDQDSDNDGLTDAEERAANTNPCGEDTDGDGVPDLTERVAMSNPTDRTSMPPAGSLYVTLPYHPPGTMGEHAHREFTFSTRIRAADIMFVVDTTGSMGATISNVQSTLTSRIIPGIRAALGPMGDARYGIAGHGDFAEGGTNQDGAVRVYQRLDRDPMRSQAATGSLRASGGGDEPESQVPGMDALISGFGVAGYGGTAVRPMNPVTDCGATPDSPQPFGWACFLPGRVPIIVLFSDAAWHNGPSEASNFYRSVPTARTYAQLAMEMQRRGAYFVGIDVSSGRTYMNSLRLASDTRTFDGAGRAIAFMGSASTVADNVVAAITTIAGQSRQDITTRVDPNAADMARLPPMRTTAQFIRAVTPVRGIPDAPMGYDRRDMTTFFNVAPSTQVVFDVDFYNDFQPGAATAQLFRATIVVLGRARSEVDRREVFIIVPAAGAQPPG